MPNIKTNISFSLVNIPVIMNPIIKNNDTSFNQLHKKCLHQIKYLKYCPFCKKNVLENDIIKGYKTVDEEFLTFNKDELKKLQSENNQEIEIISFINEEEVAPYYYEKSYFLNTNKKSKAYNLFCEALKKTNKIALCKTVLNSKFYYATLSFRNNGIIMNTLFFDEEVNIPLNDIKNKINNKELNMAIELVKSLSGKFEPEKYRDEYQDRIKKAIKDKLKGQKIESHKKTSKKKINDLMKALEASLKEVK